MSAKERVMGDMPPVLQLAHLRHIQESMSRVRPGDHELMSAALAHLFREFAHERTERGETVGSGPRDPILDALPKDVSGFEFFQLYIDHHVRALEQRCHAPRFVQDLVTWVVRRKSSRLSAQAVSQLGRVREQLARDGYSV